MVLFTMKFLLVFFLASIQRKFCPSNRFESTTSLQAALYKQTNNTIQYTKQLWDITPEGKEVLEHGSPEWLLFSSIPTEGISKEELAVCITILPTFSNSFFFLWLAL